MPRSFTVRVIACLFLLGWSAPSAIGIAGLGGGFELGIEVSGRRVSAVGLFSGSS